MISFDRSKHRNLFNGDCTFLFFGTEIYNPGGGPYTAKVFHDFVDLLADSGVDTFVINPNAQHPWYPSKRTPHVLTHYKRGDRDFFRGHYPPFDKDWTPEMLEKRLDQDVKFLNRYQDLADAGVIWIDEISKACRRRGVSPWTSVRMNDMHGGNSWEKSYMNCELQKNPKYRLRGQQINLRDSTSRWLTPMNFEHKEVRDFFFTMMAELVEDHDFDGLELDWFRQPFCCEPPASKKTIEMMTVWMKDIRAMTQARAKKIGKPFALGVRSCVRLGTLLDVGLDLKTWAREGLIDFVGPTNGWQTSWDVPYDELRRELGDSITIYGMIEDAPNWMFALEPKSEKKSYRLLSTSAEFLRGNAASKLALGADGIETFNFFCSDEVHHNPVAGTQILRANYPALRGLEKLENLRGKPKQYALASMHGYWQFQPFEYAEQVPAILEPDWHRAFRLSMCAEPAKANLELIIQLIVAKKGKLPDLGVSFNGCWPNFDAKQTDALLFPTGIYTHHMPEHTAFNYRFDASLIKDRWNEIVVYNGNHQRATPEERQANSVCIVSVELALR